MKLRVTYRRADDPAPINVQITADATATAGAVARALALGPGADRLLPDGEALTLKVVDAAGVAHVLTPTQPVINSGLVSGSVVEVRRASAHTGDRGPAVALLRVVAGPDTGIEIPLPAGASAIGRAPECDVRLTDPLVSKWHARLEVRDGVEVVDTNSANGVLVGGVRVSRVAIGPGDVVQLGDSAITVAHERRPAQATASASTDIGFVRPPRVLSRRTEQKIELPQPPGEIENSRFPWLAMLAPLIMGGVMFAVTRSPLSIVFVALSPLLMVGNWLAQRSDNKRKRKLAASEFTRRLAEAETRLAEAHDLERRQLEALHPCVADCVDQIVHLGDALWSRRPEHPEFLQVRLGLGAIAPMVAVENASAPGQAEFTEPRDALVSRFAKLADAAVVADLRSVGGLGICGLGGLAEGVARAVVAQVVALHSPTEVVLACLTSTVGRGRWLWAEWLPHAASPRSPIGSLQLASDAATGRLLLDRLEELVAARLGGDKQATLRGPVDREQDAPAPVLPAVLLIVDEPLVDVGRLTRLSERGPDVGVHVLWVTQDRRALPAACRTFLDLGDGTVAKVGQVRTGELISPVRCEALDAGTAMMVARRLAPVVDIGMPMQDESDVPRMVSVVSLLGQDTVDDPEQILSRWRENGSWIDRSTSPQPRERPGDLRAVVGHTGADVFTLDLRGQGPHALVGGTTGSGKSEFLQAWVLGLAHAYSPDRLTFLFVDYKGGAAFAKCVDLPHYVGMVTDLSPHLVRRALRSLRAEIHHRENLLNDKGVKDLIDFESTGDHACPPSLVIVVDEFAALKGEVPEFVDGLIDVAQRGRSLGLHLIMATQRPAGVITDSLRANTNLRVALRMNDDHDSTDVLGDKMAARFDPSIPGRGAARTGPGRIAQFQSGFPGARTTAEPPAPPIEIVELDFGLGKPWKIAKPATSGAKPRKDIERVVDSVKRAAALGQVPAPRRPWLDTLADAYNLETLNLRRPRERRTDAQIVLGLLDDPDHQSQETVYFEPDKDGNILFAGCGGSGKTTALRTLAIATALVDPARGPVHVYGIDFSGGGLSLLEPLPNVGSVVQGDDEERIGRLIRLLSSMIEERQMRYQQGARASSLNAYRQLSGRFDEPRVLLLVDGFQIFRAEYDASVQRSAVYNAFQKILSQGGPVGIHVAMTVDRLASVPNALAATVQRKVILRQTDEDAYVSAGVPKDVLNPASPPGRALLAGNTQELQLAIVGNDGTPGAQATLVEELAAELGATFKPKPERIRSLPLNVPGSSLPAASGGQPVLGLEDVSLAPFGFDPRGPAIVAGPPQSGRSTAMRWLAESLRLWSPDTALVHLSARASALAGLPIWTASTTGAQPVQAYVTEKLKPYLEQAPGERPTVAVFIEYYPEFGGTAAEMALNEMAVLARRNGHPLFVEGEAGGFGGFQSFLTEVKQARCGLILQPDQNDGDNLFRTPLPRIRRGDFPPGRGFWVKAGKVFKVQIPMAG